jgi:DNA replication and repair protein RecF
MPISQLAISGVRNLKQASLSDCHRINVISGPNGSGKTSILEAIHLLGLGRSFRSTRLKPVINHELEEATVYASLEGGPVTSIGVTRSKKAGFEYKINREQVSGTAELARALPLQVINAESHLLVDGGPKCRRQFIDWGVFHVEHGFLGLWRKAQKLLKQRNSLLRRGGVSSAEMRPWDQELASCAALIDSQRQQYVESFVPLFYNILSGLVDLDGVDLSYQRGWQQGEDLGEVFQRNLSRELERGHTISGPHRANLSITQNGVPAQEVMSRGQIKLLVSAMRLAQGLLLEQQGGGESIYLIDDLPAELDLERREAFCGYLERMTSQAFITAVDADDLRCFWSDPKNSAVFHVKHGQVEKQSNPH